MNIRTKGHWRNVLRAAVDRGGLPEAWSVFVRGLYRRIRIRLPTRSYTAYNGVTVLIERKLLDELVPSKWLPTDTRDLATYESALVLGIREHVRPGDRVVIVGGGWGVTTVVAAQKAGEQGSIITFEERSESVRRVRWAVETARCSPTVQVVHRRVDGSVPESAPDRLAAVRPEDLPDCEVLEMDCEGAELVILQRMTIRPRVILVESHGALGSSSKDVRDTLEGLWYNVVAEQVAESHYADLCMDRDVMVLEAIR